MLKYFRIILYQVLVTLFCCFCNYCKHAHFKCGKAADKDVPAELPKFRQVVEQHIEFVISYVPARAVAYSLKIFTCRCPVKKRGYLKNHLVVGVKVSSNLVAF